MVVLIGVTVAVLVLEYMSMYVQCSELTENNEELQAQLLNRQVREGRSLLTGQQGSLAADMGAMTEEQVDL